MSSVGRTTSAPWTREKGVWPVARFGVVLIDQRTTGNSLIQRLPLLCSLSKVLVLSPRSTSVFALFRLAVASRVSNRGKIDLAAKVLDVLLEGASRELRTVVGDDPVRHTKTAHQSLEELDG